MSARVGPSYFAVRAGGVVHRTVHVTDSTLVDVDKDGHIIGIEQLDGPVPNWLAVLAYEHTVIKRQGARRHA